MTLSVTHTKVATLPDQPGVEINKAEWNADHTLTGAVDLSSQVTGTLPPGNGGTGITALGTGVATALAINVGSAGAFLTANAAPSYPVTVAGTVTSGGIPYFSSTTVESSSGLLAANSPVLGGGAGAAPKTDSGFLSSGTGSTFKLQSTGGYCTGTASSDLQLTSAVNGFSEPTATFLKGNGAAGAAVFSNYGIYGAGASTASSASIWINGDTPFVSLSSGGSYSFSASSPGNFTALNTTDTSINRAGPNQLVFSGQALGSSAGGLTTSRVEINKNVAAIANNTATATLTVTIPNGNHSAGGKIILKGAAGAGGAIGADEFTALIEYDWSVARTTGVNAVATLSTALLTAITSSVAGGATPTISAALSAISGAVGAVNTFTFNVTINALTGSSTNHTCFTYLTGLNDNSSGVTFA